MEIKIGKFGILADPDLHDGQLCAIHTLSKESAYVICSSLTGESFKFTFGGIRALCASNFREGNIIHIFWILRGKEIPDKQIEELIFGKNWDDRKQVLKAASEIQKGDYLFAHIEPSYGCDLKVLCQSIGIERI